MEKKKRDNDVFSDIPRLVRLLERSQIGEIEIWENDRKIRLAKRRQNGKINLIPPNTVKQESMVLLPQPSEIVKKITQIKSTMVGYFYTAPAPDAEPFVKVGDLIHQGQILGIIEAMGLKTELKSDFAGRLLKILVDDTQPVEYDQPLFEIEIL